MKSPPCFSVTTKTASELNNLFHSSVWNYSALASALMRVMQSHCSSAGVTFRLYLKTPDACQSPHPSLSHSVFLYLLLDAGAALVNYAFIKGRQLPPLITASHLSEARDTNADSVASMSGILVCCWVDESPGAKRSVGRTYAARLKKRVGHNQDLSWENHKRRQRTVAAIVLFRSRERTADMEEGEGRLRSWPDGRSVQTNPEGTEQNEKSSQGLGKMAIKSQILGQEW